ncbi:sensor histidine kinase [Nostoc sp. CHAB 5834]|nr:sensor histidine kinase [Nostoc sp. CHAB 5834]
MKAATQKRIYTAGTAIIIAILFKLFFFRLDQFFEFDLLYIVCVVLLLWEGNLFIDRLLNTYYSWLLAPRKRLILQVLCCSLFTAIFLFDVMYLIHQLKFGNGEVVNQKMKEIFVPTLFIAFTILAIAISNQFFIALKNSLVQVEKYKNESINAQLKNLKNQINPHFLFNNLSVLTALVYKDQDKATHFINELSKVYRYILENNNIELISLREELSFLQHYIYLLEIRFGSSIKFCFDMSSINDAMYILPMCLQMMVENAIQHNETMQDKSLQISIQSTTDSVVVRNSIQLRHDFIDSSKTGLRNIQLRYSFFTDRPIEIEETSTFFCVTLPLIFKNKPAKQNEYVV